MNTVKFSCVVSSTDFIVPLGMEIWLDEHQLFNKDHVDQPCHVEHEIADDNSDHQLRFVLKNKLWDHTQVDDEGNIVGDARVIIRDISFDEIDCQYLTTKLALYQHDLNGTSSITTQSFYGEMGCNGTVLLKFSTPIYIWLLENM